MLLPLQGGVVWRRVAFGISWWGSDCPVMYCLACTAWGEFVHSSGAVCQVLSSLVHGRGVSLVGISSQLGVCAQHGGILWGGVRWLLDGRPVKGLSRTQHVQPNQVYVGAAVGCCLWGKVAGRRLAGVHARAHRRLLWGAFRGVGRRPCHTVPRGGVCLVPGALGGDVPI